MSVFRIPVARSKEETKTFSREKLFSYREVEDILYQAIEDLNSTELIRRNSIDIKCIHHCKEQGVMVIVRQENEVCEIFLKGGAE